MNSESKIDVFVCGPKATCYKCRLKARCVCTVCAKGMCITHARKVGDEHRCATHAPMTTNPAMPKPIGRP